MSKSRLVSGRVKKLTGADLDPNRNNYLSIGNAEPDLGLPSTTGQILISTATGQRSWSTISGAGVATTLNGLDDVVVTSAITGQVLKFNGTNWVNGTDDAGAGSGGATTLDGLDDVVAPSPVNGQTLIYNTSTSNWINGTVNIPYFVLSGPTSVYINQTVTYTINDYDAFSIFSVSVNAGSASISGNIITFTAPTVAGSVIMTISSESLSRNVTITILTSGVQAPIVTNPASNPYTYYIGTLPVNSFTFTTGAFIALGAPDTHLNSDWQLASDAAFTTIVQSSMASVSNKTSWTRTLSTPGTYYLHVRHRGNSNGVSSYSNVVTLYVLAASVETPTITSPDSGILNYNSPNVTFTSSAFAYLGTFDAHASSDWQLSTDSEFGTIVQSVSASTTNKTSWTVSGLSVATTYYARVRYTGSTNGTSSYSEVWDVTTISEFSSYIATPTATPAAFGDALEGGFYTGRIWNEVVQSASSFSLTTGQKTFIVADMTSIPLVYQGQSLEVRSRNNPANKMFATVAQAGSTNLVLNVTSVAGSGTFADWSIMALYRIIVAPKATGETSAIYKTSIDAAPAACITLSEGRKATLAMVAAGNSTVYPAAHFCNNLNIASRTDWYMPARDELELIWRNLKPVSGSNYTGADRQNAVDYKNLGSPGDTSVNTGTNVNTAPVGAAYTASAPAQVAAGKNFRTGETEALSASTTYWSSSEYQSANAWYMQTSDGRQYANAKNGSMPVRAVRRSII